MWKNIFVRKLCSYDIPDPVVSLIIGFLTSYKQPVKLGPDCFSEWGVIPIGVLQGTKLGLWLFIIIINKLDAPAMNLWEYLDDNTILETISKNQESHIQAAVDTLVNGAFGDKFQLNKTKCKEPHINFSTKKTTSFDHIMVNDMPIELVATAKIPGLNVSRDLKWNCHIDSIMKKAKKCL